jgi:hypothetical protein
VGLLIELGQLAITLTVSGVVAFLVGPTYVVIATLVIATCLVLLYEAAKSHSASVGKPIKLVELGSIAVTAIVFGAIWPAIPLVFTWKRSGGALVDDVEQ